MHPSSSDTADFIRANTRLMSPPLVPEVQLYLAAESLPIWAKTEEELGEMNLPPPYWAFAWAGGQALARYLFDAPETVAGKNVLDVGSGSGLVAVASRLAGGRYAVANDIDRFANAACALNAEANGVTIDISSADLLDEYDPDYVDCFDTSDLSPTGPSFDIVCLGDTFYEEALAIDALAFAERAVASGARVIIGDPQRSYFPAERFSKIAEYAVPVTRELEDNEIKNSAVWQFAG